MQAGSSGRLAAVLGAGAAGTTGAGRDGEGVPMVGEPAGSVPHGSGVWPHMPGSSALSRARSPAARGVPRELGDVPTVPLPVVRGAARASVVGRLGAVVRRFVPGDAGARLDPGRPGATALALVAAAAASVAAFGVWVERPRAEPVGALPAVTSSASAEVPSALPGAPAGSVVVSVVGKVRSPGLVTVPAGSRVADAVEAAGGALPGVDLTGVNLARRLEDGEQVPVGVPAAPDAGGAAPAGDGAGAPASGGGRVDLNRATASQLDSLPGVGPVTAERILEWRDRNGRFTRVEQLREVDGIGERRFSQLRTLVTVS